MEDMSELSYDKQLFIFETFIYVTNKPVILTSVSEIVKILINECVITHKNFIKGLVNQM